MIESLQQPQSLPHSEESERAVLGGVLLDPGRFPTLSARLGPEDFFAERNRILFQAMLDVQAGEAEIDLRTLQGDDPKLVEEAVRTLR